MSEITKSKRLITTFPIPVGKIFLNNTIEHGRIILEIDHSTPKLHFRLRVLLLDYISCQQGLRCLTPCANYRAFDEPEMILTTYPKWPNSAWNGYIYKYSLRDMVIFTHGLKTTIIIILDIEHIYIWT